MMGARKTTAAAICATAIHTCVVRFFVEAAIIG
jgi:hypothetical protein